MVFYDVWTDRVKLDNRTNRAGKVPRLTSALGMDHVHTDGLNMKNGVISTGARSLPKSNSPLQRIGRGLFYIYRLLINRLFLCFIQKVQSQVTLRHKMSDITRFIKRKALSQNTPTLPTPLNIPRQVQGTRGQTHIELTLRFTYTVTSTLFFNIRQFPIPPSFPAEAQLSFEISCHYGYSGRSSSVSNYSSTGIPLRFISTKSIYNPD